MKLSNPMCDCALVPTVRLASTRKANGGSTTIRTTANSKSIAASPDHNRSRKCAMPCRRGGIARAASLTRPSHPPSHECVLIKLRPILVFTNKVRPIGQIKPLHLSARPCHVAARRIIAEFLVEELRLLRHQEIRKQHGGMGMGRLTGDCDARIGHRHWTGREPAERR